MTGAFGVEIPDNLGETTSAPESTGTEGRETNAAESTAAKETETREPGIQDLDSLERFRFQGKELSRDDLQKLIAGQSSGEESSAKYDKHFRYDLTAVLEDPSKLAAFREIYPPEYVAIVEKTLAAQRREQGDQSRSTTQQDGSIDRLTRLEKIAEQWEQAQTEQRVTKITGALDKSFDKFSKKYPDADQEVVNSRLIALRSQGKSLQKEDGSLREDIIEDMFKRDHGARAKAYEDRYRQKVEAQKQANNQARDVGQGGAVSSPPGKKPQTIKDATELAIATLSGG